MTNTDFLNYVEEETDAVLPNEDKLGRLTALAREQLKLQHEIEDMQLRLKGRQEALEKISEHEIPELMFEIGTKSIQLLDGRWLKINPFYSGKITGPECYDWLEQNGYADIVKTNIVVAMKMSDVDKAAAVRKLLHDNGIDWDENSGVHHSTLKAWIKDTINSGKPIDRDLFNVFTGFRATIK